MLSAAKHLSLINIAETLRQAQGDNTPYSTWMPDQVRHDSKKKRKSGMTVKEKQVRHDGIKKS